MNDRVGVYAYWDHKSKTYDIPFFAKNDYMAARRFIMDVKRHDGHNVLREFRDDVEVWLLGYWSQTTGKFQEEFSIVHQGKEVEE